MFSYKGQASSLTSQPTIKKKEEGIKAIYTHIACS